MMKKFLCSIVVLFLMLIIPNSVNAAECSDSEIIRLQKLANNVNTSYMYDENTKRFNITFTNLTKELVLRSINDNKDFNADKEMTLKNLYSGNHKFYVYAKNKSCTKDILSTKYVTLPFYNSFYGTDLCKGIEDYSYCSKWLSKNIEDDIISENISKYKTTLNKNKENVQKKDIQGIFDNLEKLIANVYVKYYYIILPLIITISCVVIYIKNKKDDLV